jgi:peptidoglycan/LPS O-acetylase OafA/YrhL
LVVLIISSSKTADGKLQRFVSATSGTAFLLAACIWYAVGEKGVHYLLYLWQELFIPVDGPSWGAACQLPLAFVVPIAISVLSYHFMERPILQLKDRIAGEASRRGLSTQIDSAPVRSFVTDTNSAAEPLKRSQVDSLIKME